MCSYALLKVDTLKTLLLIAFILLLSGCDMTAPTGPKTSAVCQESKNAPVNQDTLNALNKASTSECVQGAYVQLPEGIQCSLGLLDTRHASYPSDKLVLQTENLIYTDAQIQQMRNYLKSLYTHVDSLLVSYLNTPPPTLRWVSGASTCEGNLHITNTGESLIQIQKVGVRLAKTFYLNNYHYRLIDACTILPEKAWQGTACGPVPTSGNGGCSVYQVYVHLSARRAVSSTEFTGTPRVVGNDSCFELTLKPNETIDLDVLFDTSTYPDNVIYSAMPELILDMPSSPQPLLFPRLTNTLIFTNPDQYSCYKLQGTTFVQEDFFEGWCM